MYRACALMGLADPRHVDELEFWEIAAILGVNEPPADDTDAGGPIRPVEDGPIPENVARMLADPRSGVTAPSSPSKVLDLIRGGAKGGLG